MSFTYHESCLETATIKKEEFLEVRKELLLERLRKKYRRFAPIVTSCGRLETYNHLIKPCPQCINRKVSYSWEKTLDIILNRKYVIPQDKKYAAMLRTMVKHGFGSLYTQCEYPTPKIAWQGMTRVIPFYDPLYPTTKY